MIWRKKIWWENFFNFSTLQLLSLLFNKTSVKSTSYLVNWFNEIFWPTFSFFTLHSVVMSEIYPHFEKFSWNQSSKNVTLTKFLQKIVGKNFQISALWDGNSLSRIFGKNFVRVTVLLNKLIKSWFDEIFFRWERISRFSTLCTPNSQNLTL